MLNNVTCNIPIFSKCINLTEYSYQHEKMRSCITLVLM